MTRFEKVKNDLRELKKTVHLINTMKNAQTKYEKMIEMLKQSHLPYAMDEIKRLKAVLSLMKIDVYVKKAMEIEQRYMKIIKSLNPLDKTIILEAFVNGLPYWKIGMEIGYSEDGTRKRANKIIKSIANEMKEREEKSKDKIKVKLQKS